MYGHAEQRFRLLALSDLLPVVPVQMPAYAA